MERTCETCTRGLQEGLFCEGCFAPAWSKWAPHAGALEAEIASLRAQLTQEQEHVVGLQAGLGSEIERASRLEERCAVMAGALSRVRTLLCYENIDGGYSVGIDALKNVSGNYKTREKAHAALDSAIGVSRDEPPGSKRLRAITEAAEAVSEEHDDQYREMPDDGGRVKMAPCTCDLCKTVRKLKGEPFPTICEHAPAPGWVPPGMKEE